MKVLLFLVCFYVSFMMACGGGDSNEDSSAEDAGGSDDSNANAGDDNGDSDDGDKIVQITTATQCLHDANCQLVFPSAHRGICGDAPENTISSAKQCVALGIPMIETDTRDTADGNVVIMHDSDTSSTTDGETRFPDKPDVEQLTLEEFKSLVIDNKNCTGDDIDPEWCHPASLVELIEATAPDTILFIDYKGGAIDILINTLMEHGAAERTVIFDSNVENLKAAKQIDPNMEVMPRATSIEETKQIANDFQKELNLTWIHIDEGYSKDVFKDMQKLGIRLYFDVFTSIDPLLLLAQQSSRPEKQYESAWEKLDEIIQNGGRGLGSNATVDITKHLYPYGFGKEKK